ncbi:TPA: AAA family ATPase [Vibrio vulnificus]
MKLFYSEDLTTKPDYGDHVVLVEDTFGRLHSNLWDDFGFKITFKCFLTYENEKHELGYIKLLFNGKDHSRDFIKSNFSHSDDGFYELNDSIKDFVTVGNEIKYYKKLNSIFDNNTEALNKYLSLINDVSYNINNEAEYQKWDGFSGSFLRESSHVANMTNGYKIATGSYSPKDEFTMTVEGEPFVDFNFSVLSNTFGNANILVGNNGYGKTQLLKKISRIFTGLEKQEERWPFFHKLLVVSFSPFESFLTEKELAKALGQSTTGKKKRTSFINEYSYIGIKSDNKTNPISIDSVNRRSVSSYLKALQFDIENGCWFITDDIYEKQSLIDSTLKKAMPFAHMGIRTKSGAFFHSDNLIEQLLSDSDSFKDSVNYEYGLVFLDESDNEIKLSSGQKIYSHIIPGIISEITDESLILIDEPELYLHPELEIGLISMLKNILSETRSFAIIATHSTITVREFEREHVHIFRERGHVMLSEIQTFGSSLEEIGDYVFNGASTKKSYQEAVEDIADNYETTEEIIEKYSSELGSGAIAHLYQIKHKAKDEDIIKFED